MTNSKLISNWETVKEKIKAACDSTGSKNISLLAVSKTKPASMVAELYWAGQTDFGENYLQEAVDKIKEVKRLAAENSDIKNTRPNEICWHYIGHIQRNKTKDIAQTFDWVHTIERDIIAKRLNKQRPENLENLNVLIQINIDNEASKSGCMPEELEELIESVKNYERLNLRGLMIIPSQEDTGAFKRTKRLFDKIKTQHPELKKWDTLSMGMSADMQQAIKHGSNMVRVGTAIFGERD